MKSQTFCAPLALWLDPETASSPQQTQALQICGWASLPVNTLEAESRRVARFFASGHTPGPFDPPPEERSPDYACTLDLRRRR